MAEYLIYFNQQWVGDHPEEWFRPRGPLARAVVEEMKEAGVYVFAGGLEEEDGPIYHADPTSGSTVSHRATARSGDDATGHALRGQSAGRRFGGA